MIAFLRSPSAIQFFGISGSLVAILGSLLAGVVYRGREGERYSPLNHFISELGEIGVSRWAWAFNLGLFLGGLLLLPCCIGIGLLIPGIWSILGVACGCIAAVAVSLVGVFPMNNLTMHNRAAMTFFRLGLAMILFLTIAIFTQPGPNPPLPRSIGLVGLPAIFSYSAFLIDTGRRTASVETNPPLDPAVPEPEPPRPRIWALTVYEWLVFLTTIPWFFAISLGL